MKNVLFLFACFYVVCPVFAQKIPVSALFPLPNAEGKWGYVDAQKNVKIPYQFMGATPFYEERALVTIPAKNEYGFTTHVIDTTGKVLFEVRCFTYKPVFMCRMDFMRYSEGLLGINLPNEKKKTITYLDKGGKRVIVFENAVDDDPLHFPFSNGLAYVQTYDTNQIYINKKGERQIVVPCSEVIGMTPQDLNFGDGLAVAYIKNKSAWGYINTKGKYQPITEKVKNIQDLGAMSEGIAFVSLADISRKKALLLKKNGKIISISVDVTYSSPVTDVSGYKFSHGLALIKTGYSGNMTYINTKGKVAFELPESITKAEHTQGSNFHQGLACWYVSTKDDELKFFYITTKGKIAFESPSIKKY